MAKKYIVKSLKAREVLDSRGNPTVEVDVTLADGSMGRAAVPSGASTGSREALELRDKDKSRYLGKGVLVACQNVNGSMAKALSDWSGGFEGQRQWDKFLLELDGTANKSKLGANAILGASMAFCRAIAQAEKQPLYRTIRSLQSKGRNISRKELVLPVPFMNIVNGGAHAHNGLDFQEFMVVPAGAKTFSKALQMGVEVFHQLKAILTSEGLGTTVGDEGGFAPSFDDYEDKHEQVIEFILQAIDAAGYEAGKDIYLALDSAASEFYENGKYSYEGRATTSEEMIAVYSKLVDQYPIVSIEDGLAEQDWDGWKKLTEKLGKKVQIVGDDIFVTNPKILQEGIDKHIGNALLVKLNQIGTVSETLDAVAMAETAGYCAMISHRSGETEDAFIADLAVGLSTAQIKTGSASRSDRTAKYNQLLRIEEELGSSAVFDGLKSISCLGTF